MSKTATPTDYNSATAGYDPSGAQVVSHNLGHHAYDMMIRMTKLGFSFDGGASLNPEMVPAIDALFEVLAGGEVEVKVKHRGNPDIVAELQKRLTNSIAESNQINGGINFYLVVTA